MPRYNIEIRVMPRATLLDPQGTAVEHALTELDFAGLSGVRVGRAIHLDIESADRESAESEARTMCDRLLANPVTEDYSVTATEG